MSENVWPGPLGLHARLWFYWFLGSRREWEPASQPASRDVITHVYMYRNGLGRVPPPLEKEASSSWGENGEQVEDEREEQHGNTRHGQIWSLGGFPGERTRPSQPTSERKFLALDGRESRRWTSEAFLLPTDKGNNGEDVLQLREGKCVCVCVCKRACVQQWGRGSEVERKCVCV